MKTVDIMETIVEAIEDQIIGNWRHEGFVGGWNSKLMNFEIDGKEYVLRISEVKEGEHWCEK